jgi:hypothetical protein
MYQRFVNWADGLMIPLLFVIAIGFGLRMHRGYHIGFLLTSDSEGYYIYLPATFLYENWKVRNGEDWLRPVNCCMVTPEGKVVTRYTYGVAAMQAPFFGLAHLYARTFQGPDTPPPPEWEVTTGHDNAPQINYRKYSRNWGQATGFSDTYAYGIIVAAAFYMSLGLWFLKRALRRSFRKDVALITTGLIFLATTLFYYTAGEGSMSHVYSFCLFAAILYYLPDWLREPTWGRTIVLGILLGLTVLIRPTNILITLLFPFWSVYSVDELRLRVRTLRKQWVKLASMAVLAFLVLVPQGLYWKGALGSWVAWSYGKEGFSNWNHPPLLKVLFSYQNGLFVYTPIMVMVVAGLVVGWRRRMASAPVISVIFLLATYFFASWWAWWFGAAFGHRCFVEYMALFAFPLAVMVKLFADSKYRWVKAGGLLLALVFVYMNVKLSMMYAAPWDGPNWTWERFMDHVGDLFRVTWWPGF